MSDTHFEIFFNGRKKNAIGAFSNFNTSVFAETAHDAVLKLYDQYEHISVDRIVNIKTKEECFPKTEKQIGSTYWLKHMNSWFAFEEPAYFKFDSDGGYFASRNTHEQIHSIFQNGFSEPQDDVILNPSRRNMRK